MSQRQDPIASRLSRMIAQNIRDAIRFDWLRGAGAPAEILVRPSPRRGSTDAITYEVDARLKFFVKFHFRDVEEERRGHLLLQQSEVFAGHLIPPLFRNINDNLWLIPYASGVSLHDVISRELAEDKWIDRLYGNFLDATGKLWASTKSPTPPDLKASYAEPAWKPKRVTDLGQELRVTPAQLGDLKVKVNGESIGTIQDLIYEMYAGLDEMQVRHSCMSHGDEHARNIMVYNEAIASGDPTGWVLVDYVTARESADWVLSIAKMLTWWQFYYVLEEAKRDPEVRNALKSRRVKRGDTLHLSYDEDAIQSRLPDICRTLRTRLKGFVQDGVSGVFQESERDWSRRLELALFSMNFGLVSTHLREHPYAVPVLFGKCIEYLRGETSPFG